MNTRILLVTALLATGCKPPRPAAPAAKAEPEYFKVDPANAASLRGTVRFAGKAPAAKRISMDAEEACQSLHKTPVYDEKVAAGKDGGLADVFVYVKSGLEGKTFPPASEAVVLDQRGCQFVPRIVPLRAGQTFSVRNSDPVSHNIHPRPKNNYEWNQQQPPQSADLRRRFARPEIMIPVKCNVHSWMKCYIAVLDHPYFAVTDRTGAFSVSGLPPGDYTLAAWHESLGELTRTITLKAGESGTAQFEFR